MVLEKIAANYVHWYIMCHGYRAWSAIYRFFWCRQYGSAELPKRTIQQAQDKMRGFQWRADGATAGFDAVASPQAVEAIGFDPTTEKNNDCDEEGIWLANTIEDPTVEKAEFMTVSWRNPDDSPDAINTGYNGHNVCLLTETGGLRYMDYGPPSALRSSELEVALDVVRDYTRGRGRLLCWHVSSKDLVPLRGQVVV